MSTLLPFIVVGVATGSVYALAGIGLVVTYKTSGILNFAHGSIATIAAYIFYGLYVKLNIDWPIAAVISIGAVAILGGTLMARLATRLAEVETSLQVVATVGIAVAVQAIGTGISGATILPVNNYLPQELFRFLGVNISYAQLILFLLALALAAILSFFFKRSRRGIAMRGVVGDADLIALCRISPNRVRRGAWIIGSFLSASAGVLLLPVLGLDSTALTLLVLQAFGAAAIGAFSNLWLTYAGGLIVGIGQALITKFTVQVPTLSGLSPSFPFIALFLVLLLLPKRRLALPVLRHLRRIRRNPPLPRKTAIGGCLLAALALTLIPVIQQSRISFWTVGLVFALVFASLHMLVQTSGQISLCHPTFVAIGATTFANLTGGPRIPWLLALVLAGLIAVPVGALVAIPAIRLSGIYLAVATFGFGLFVEDAFYNTPLMFGSFGRTAPRPIFLGINLTGNDSFYYLVLLIFIVGVALAYVVQRGRLGRLLAAASNSPIALESYGASVAVTRVIIFCISAFLASIGGALYAAASTSISSLALPSSNALLWLVVLIFAATLPRIGSNLIAASIGAGIMLMVIPGYITSDTALNYLPVLFGVSALYVSITAARTDSNRRAIEESESRPTASLELPSRSRDGVLR